MIRTRTGFVCNYSLATSELFIPVNVESVSQNQVCSREQLLSPSRCRHINLMETTLCVSKNSRNRTETEFVLVTSPEQTLVMSPQMDQESNMCWGDNLTLTLAASVCSITCSAFCASFIFWCHTTKTTQADYSVWLSHARSDREAGVGEKSQRDRDREPGDKREKRRLHIKDSSSISATENLACSQWLWRLWLWSSVQVLQDET